MNNRKILIVFSCANFLLGILFYLLFFTEEKFSPTSSTVVGMTLTCIGLYIVSYSLYKKRSVN
jgi:drug/metabolite transporter (DMT)-like permease